ncbi:MAG: hypothetical protein BA871_14435 [Desulfuromonadales bacterium C00003096]|jgi:hypothetical protein|nr:MAG: hypothetical protein BA871_14435 [Desulfuromonadales bacterium C00003096]
MTEAPVFKGSEYQQAEKITEKGVGALSTKKRPMHTVMKYDEDSDQKGCSRKGKKERYKVRRGVLNRPDHQIP